MLCEPDVPQSISKGTKLGHFAKPNKMKIGVWRIFDICLLCSK